MAKAPQHGWGTKSRHERGYGRRWTQIRETILARDKYLCQACLKQGRLTPLKVRPYDHAVDHIKPKSQGGDDSHSNLQSLCAPCHAIKTDEEAKAGQGVKPKPAFDPNGKPIWD